MPETFKADFFPRAAANSINYGKTMSVSHAQMKAAVDATLMLERNLTFPHKKFPDRVSRHAWLSEGDLVARLRAELVTSGACPAETTRLAANGKTNKALYTNHDIEYDGGATEAVYCHSKSKSGMPGVTLSDDLIWLLGRPTPGSHVVAFVPRMLPGYKVKSAYSEAGKKLSLVPGDKLLSDLVQVGGLATNCRPLLAGLLKLIMNPAAGRKSRWSLATSQSALVHPSITRSVVGNNTDNLWAVVWSRY